MIVKAWHDSQVAVFLKSNLPQFSKKRGLFADWPRRAGLDLLQAHVFWRLNN